MPIRAVLWDIDDTIFDYAGAARTGMRQHLEREGFPGTYVSMEGALDAWTELSVRHWERLAAGETDFAGQRRDRVREFLSRDLRDAEADEWFDRHAAHYEAAWALFPDVLPVLDLLSRDYRHGILSNANTDHQHHKLTALGVRDRFEVMVCAVELGSPSRRPEPSTRRARRWRWTRARWRTWATSPTSTRAGPSPPA